MVEKMTCAKCGSAKVMGNLYIPDYHSHHGDKSDLSVEIYENPGAVIFKDKRKVKLTAQVCGDCGYTELYVDSPKRLWKIYQEQQ